MNNVKVVLNPVSKSLLNMFGNRPEAFREKVDKYILQFYVSYFYNCQFSVHVTSRNTNELFID